MESDREQDERVMSIFSRALRLTPAERESYVRFACQSDQQLYQEITEAMEWEQRMGSFLQHPMIAFKETVRPFEAGQIISERFEIIREIGEGGMGVVYEALDRKRNQRIAIKAAKTGFGRLLSPELEGALKVRHPNVCLVNEIHTAQTDHGEVDFLTMELLEGETLSARLSVCGKLPAKEATEIARQLCSGLAEAHRCNVIHRDLKAANVILCRTTGAGLRAVITDFGLSGGEDAEAGTIGGTPGYMALELWQGVRASKASDIYSLGVILREMVVGRPHSAGANVEGRVPTEDVSSSYLDLVEEFVSIDPDRREQAFQKAQQALARRPWSRRKMLFTGAGAICALAGGAWLDRDALDNLLHPLPKKRFVALLARPPTTDARAKALVKGVIDAIENELARAEAADRDLFVILPHDGSGDDGAAPLSKIRDSLGANLVLEASSTSRARTFQLLLRVLDASTSAVLREQRIIYAMEEIALLTAKAVQGASRLLNVRWAQTGEYRLKPSTHSAAALRAFQAAEELKDKPNDDGLEAAIENYRKAIDSDPRYVSAYAKLAIAYSRFYALRRDPGALELAQANAEKAIWIDQKSADGHLALAYVFEKKGNQQKALDEVDQSLKLDPTNPRTLLWKAQIYCRFHRWGDAEEAYLRLKRERPNYWLAYQELGFVLNAQGRYQAAIQEFRVAAVAAPGSALAFNNLGALHLKLGKFAEAEQNFRSSLKLKPNDLAYGNLADTLRAEGKYADALKFSREAVKLNPSDDQNWLGLADCYDALRGQEKQAREAYQRAASEVERRLQTDPTEGPSWMRLALYRVKSRSDKDVLSLVKKAERYGASDLDSELMKARIVELSGRRKEALATLAACFKRGTTGFEVASIPDLNTLRRDPGYAQILKMKIGAGNNR